MSTSSQLANQAYGSVTSTAEKVTSYTTNTLTMGTITPILNNGLFKYVDYVGYTPLQFATAAATGSAILQTVPGVSSATATYLTLPADSYVDTVAVRATTTLAGPATISLQINENAAPLLTTVPIAAVNSRTYVVNTNFAGVTGNAGKVGNTASTVSFLPNTDLTAGACTVYLRVLVPV